MTPDLSDPPTTVSVVIATRNREALLTRAYESVLAQDVDAAIEVVIVYDQAEPQPHHQRPDPGRSVRVIHNTRSPGLAGARNSGVLASSGEFFAFCDDDDSWRPAKLHKQLIAMRRHDAIASVTGIDIEYDGSHHERVPKADLITVDMLTRSRLTGAHPSSYLMRREWVLRDVGLVDENVPGGYGEDYDWLLRLAAAGPVCTVREPLVNVLWHRGSYFTNRWRTIVDGLEYLMRKHPEIAEDRSGRARILGQQAFATAAMGDRRGAISLAAKALRADARERRAYVTLLVSAGLVKADTVVDQANKRGRGI